MNSVRSVAVRDRTTALARFLDTNFSRGMHLFDEVVANTVTENLSLWPAICQQRRKGYRRTARLLLY